MHCKLTVGPGPASSVIPNAPAKTLESFLATTVRKEEAICGAIRSLPSTVARSSSVTISDQEFRSDLAKFMTASDEARLNGTSRVSSSVKLNN